MKRPYNETAANIAVTQDWQKYETFRGHARLTLEEIRSLRCGDVLYTTMHCFVNSLLSNHLNNAALSPLNEEIYMSGYPFIFVGVSEYENSDRLEEEAFMVHVVCGGRVATFDTNTPLFLHRS
jgi:hypothetical protein